MPDGSQFSSGTSSVVFTLPNIVTVARLCAVPLAFWLDVGGTARALMVAAVMLVLVVELLNSAIEAAVDRVSLDRHRLSKRAKDIGSAAVLLSLLNVLLVWGAILAERYLA